MDSDSESDHGVAPLSTPESSVAHNYNFDDALQKTGKGIFQYFLLVVCGMCLMMVIVETLNVGFVVTMAECDLDLTTAHKGLLNGAAFLGIVLSSHLWGLLADIWGRKKVLQLCMTVSFFMSVLSSLSVNVWMMIAMRFLVGFFISGAAANTYAFLGEFQAEAFRAQALSYAGMFMAFGLALCPGIAWLIVTFEEVAAVNFHVPLLEIDFTSWRFFLLFCATIDGLLALALFFLPESPKFLLAQQRYDEALQVLQKIHIWNKKSGAPHYPVKSIYVDGNLETRPQNVSRVKVILNQTVPLFLKPMRINTLMTSFLMFSLFAASSGFFMWVPSILNNLMESKNQTMAVCDVITIVDLQQKNRTLSNHVSDCSTNTDTRVFEITFFMGLIFSVVYFMNGVIIGKLGMKVLLGFWFMICGLCSVGIIWAHNFYLIIVLLVGFLTVGVCGSIVSACIVELFPTHIRSMALCLILMVGRFGAIIGSYAVAYLINLHCDLMFILFGLLLIVSAFISIILPVKK